jgi:hypothetical protein
MVKMIDYLFYRFYWWNTKVVKNGSYPVFASIVGVAVLQIFNFILVKVFVGFFYSRIKDL